MGRRFEVGDLATVRPSGCYGRDHVGSGVLLWPGDVLFVVGRPKPGLRCVMVFTSSTGTHECVTVWHSRLRPLS
jgi:hypothetical protein